MKSEQQPGQRSKPARKLCHKERQGNTKVHKTSSEVLTTQLKSRNELPDRTRNSISLHAMPSSSETRNGKNNVGLGILTQGTSDDKFIKLNSSGIAWHKLNATDFADRESGPQDSADKRHHTEEYELNAPLHDWGPERRGETDDLVASGGRQQGLADCADFVKDDGTEKRTLNSGRHDKLVNSGVLARGEEQGLDSKGSSENVSEATLTEGDNFVTSTPVKSARDGCERESDTEHKDPRKDSSIESCDEDEIVKLGEEAGMEDKKSESDKKGARAGSIGKEQDRLWESLAAQIASKHTSQTVSACNQLRYMKFAIAKMMIEFVNSYEAACGINLDRTLMLRTHTPHFLETQEIKKTFYMKEVTSAIAKLAEIFTVEDSHEFKELRDATQTFYDLQTRKLYFERQNSSESAGDPRAENAKTLLCLLAVAAVVLALAYNGEWMALFLLVLMILFCIFLAWRGAESSQRRKRKLRAKML